MLLHSKMGFGLILAYFSNVNSDYTSVLTSFTSALTSYSLLTNRMTNSNQIVFKTYSKKEGFRYSVEKAVEEVKYLFSDYNSLQNQRDLFAIYKNKVLQLAREFSYNNSTQEYFSLDFFNSKRKIQFSFDGKYEYLTPIEAHFKRLQSKKKYMDITDLDDSVVYFKKNKKHSDIPEGPSHREFVTKYFEDLSERDMKAFLTKLTSFYNRYYKSQYGDQSSHYIFDTLKDIVKDSGREDVTIKFFKHSWPQSSIIARFEGKFNSDKVVIVGAHQDSVNQWIPWFGKAPGADDDGSGTTSTVSAFRSLVKGNFVPNCTLEFHWYAAEEPGLLGSQDVAQYYRKKHIHVKAMMHFDMTGHYARKEYIAVVQDFTDPTLTSFLRNLIDTYSTLPRVDSKCGYACSDHASWFKFGFPSAFPIEDPDIESNPNIHSTSDLVKTLDFHHVHEFAKLAIGFAIELSI